MSAPDLSPVPLFVELFAGTAALSLRLQRSKARPPVSRMGSKQGYANAILSRLGLQPGQGAHRYVWCEPDAGCQLLLYAYTRPDVAREAAEIIRSWAPGDPRKVWEWLRAEGPVKGPTPREVARWLRIVSSNRLINLDPETWRNTGAGGSTFGGSEFCTDAAALADALALPQMPAVVAPGADVDPREVARLHLLHRWSFSEKGPEKGYGGPGCPVTTDRAAWTTADRDRALGCERSAERLESMPALTPGPVDCDGMTLPEGTVAYLDPPYYQTSGYAHDIPRPEGEPHRWVEDIARRWSEAGAVVAVSEAVPMPGLVAEGWHAVEITHQRNGQRRTFSRQKREWVTLNKRPAGQMSLFDRRTP